VITKPAAAAKPAVTGMVASPAKPTAVTTTK
jgi:hypothetical protein